MEARWMELEIYKLEIWENMGLLEPNRSCEFRFVVFHILFFLSESTFSLFLPHLVVSFPGSFRNHFFCGVGVVSYKKSIFFLKWMY